MVLAVANGLKRKLEALTEILDKLAKEAKKGTPVIVEGRNDLLALRRLGIDGKIACVKASGKVLVDRLDEFHDKEVIVMTDFDRDGKKLARHITTYLQAKRVRVNPVFWKKIGALVRRDVKDIEGLPSYLERLKKHRSLIS